MSLIAFHRFLISTAILFCLGFCVRQFSEFQATRESGPLIFAVIFGVAGVALGYYLFHLRDFLKIPGRGSGLRAEAPKTSPMRSGNGHDQSRDWSTPLSTPLPKKDNGHDEQDLKKI